MNFNHLSDALECRDFEYLNDEFSKYEDFDAFYDAEYTNLMNSKHGIEVLAMACKYFEED